MGTVPLEMTCVRYVLYQWYCTNDVVPRFPDAISPDVLHRAILPVSSEKSQLPCCFCYFWSPSTAYQRGSSAEQPFSNMRGRGIFLYT